MEKILLKRATLSNWEEISLIEKSANSKLYSPRSGEKEIKKFIKKDFVFLIKLKNHIIGLVSFEIIKNKIAHCNGLVIYPKYRGKGYGSSAMKMAVRKMNKYPKIELVVHPHNSTAVSLYLSLGFEIESWYDDYFGDGQPRLLMIKK